MFIKRKPRAVALPRDDKRLPSEQTLGRQDAPYEVRPQEDSKPIGEKEEPQQEPLKYPVMVRPIYLWVSQSIQEIDPKLEAELVRFILSRQGQATTLSAGFFPLPSQTGQ